MTDVFTDTLLSWQNFCFMIGSAAALMGLWLATLLLLVCGIANTWSVVVWITGRVHRAK